MDMVRLVKRLTHQKKVGHGGTLDPIAAGVLPICLGQATRMMDHLIDSTKLYQTEIVLGITTDTFDIAGTILEENDISSINLEMINNTLDNFKGTIYQVPPMYSALKSQGTRLYQYARAGIEIQRAPREVRVLNLQIHEWNPPILNLQIECGRGVYIRSLAHDLGQSLGCGAHIKTLMRLRTGPFSIEQAISPEDLESHTKSDSWTQCLFPTDYVIGHLRVAMVDSIVINNLKYGRPTKIDPKVLGNAHHGERCRIYSINGEFTAIAKFDEFQKLWLPERVFELR